jgi:hypothetical protein
MGSKMAEERTLHATLCEVERGLFQVCYRMEGAIFDGRGLPSYQIGTCASEARLLIEQQAKDRGYVSVVWERVAPGTPLLKPVSFPGFNLSA